MRCFFIVFFSTWLAFTAANAADVNQALYDKAIHIDAEAIAELGMLDAYKAITPTLKQYVTSPSPLREIIDEMTGSYSVEANNKTYVISSPDLADKRFHYRGRATVAFFDIINRQLINSNVKFYALGRNNDLSGVFLTEREYIEQKQSGSAPFWKPYLPKLERPWYGQTPPY